MKKKQIILVSILAVFLLVIFPLGVFVSWKIWNDPYKTLSLESETVAQLMEIAKSSGDFHTLEQAYKEQTITNNFKISSAFHQYVKTHPEIQEMDKIPAIEIETLIKKLFGENTPYQKESASIREVACKLEYNKTEDTFSPIAGCDDYGEYYLHHKLTKATEDENKIEMEEKVFFTKNEGEIIFSGPKIELYQEPYEKSHFKTIKKIDCFQGDRKKLDEIVDENGNIKKKEEELNEEEKKILEEFQLTLCNINDDDYLENASTYRYTFTKENDHYIYSKIEKIN